MKHLIYLPAFLAMTAVSAYAQDAGVNTDSNTEADTGFRTESEAAGNGEAGAAAASTEAHDGAQDFSTVDKDGDGELSIEEAQEALPDLVIVDINNDGVLNRSEAENAIPGLSFDEGEDEDAEADDKAVDEEDFLAIVDQMEQDNQVGLNDSSRSDRGVSGSSSAASGSSLQNDRDLGRAESLDTDSDDDSSSADSDDVASTDD